MRHLAHLKIKLSNNLIIILLVLSIVLPVSYTYASLSCSVTTSAACTGTVLLRLSGSTNAHAELPSQSNVNYNNNVVCCSSTSSIGNSCSGNYKVVGKLSGVTNAHMEENTGINYGNNACLSDTTPGDLITIGYQNTNCTGYDTTLMSMYGSLGASNSTVGDGSAYPRKICATIFTPSITFNISSPSVTLGSLSSTSTSTGTTQTTITSSTNANGGFVLTYKGDTLKSASNTIPAWGAQSLPTLGTSQFGINAAAPTGAGCNTSTGYQTAGQYAYTANNTTTIGNATVPASCTYTVNYAADVSSGQPAGNYSTAITYIMTGTF